MILLCAKKRGLLSLKLTSSIFPSCRGGVAEWLGSGLQIHLRGFEFLHHLHLGTWLLLFTEAGRLVSNIC